MQLVSGFPLWGPEFDLRSGHMEFVVDSCTEADILQVFQFPLPILIPRTAPHYLIILSSNGI
jgi:hypothetical protein